VSCDLGSLASGETATVTIKVRPKGAGELSNTASVDSTTADPVSTNNQDTEKATVTQPPPAPKPAACAGRKATIVGTAAGETLIGTSGRDVIAARGGTTSSGVRAAVIWFVPGAETTSPPAAPRRTSSGGTPETTL